MLSKEASRSIFWVFSMTQLGIELQFPGPLANTPAIVPIGHSSYTKDLKKWYLITPCLTFSLTRYGSRVNGTIQGKEYHPPRNIGIVAIEKGNFGLLWGCPRGVIVKATDCGIVVSEFVLQSQLLRSLSGKYPWERYKPPYPPSNGLNSTTTVLQGE